MLSWSQVFHYIWAIMIVHIRELAAIVAVTRRACSSHLVSSTFYYIPFTKFILAALPSFFLSNLFPIPWTSINGPKLTTCNFLLRYFHSEYLFPGLYFDFSKSGLWGLTGFDQPLCFPALPPPQPWPSPPWQPLSVPSSPQPCLAIGPPDQPSPFHCLSSEDAQCQGLELPLCPQLPSGVVGWALAAMSCLHRLPCRAPSATGTQPPGSRSWI